MPSKKWMSHHRRDPEPEQVEFFAPEETRQEDRLPIQHTKSEWRLKLQEYRFRCAYCGIKGIDTPERYLTRDHVVPVTNGGTDVIANVVPACVACNKAKGAQPAAWMPKAKPRQQLLAWRHFSQMMRLYHGQSSRRPHR